MKKALALLLVLAATFGWSAEPKLTVTCTRATHLYAIGERAEFEITSSAGKTPVKARLSRAYLPTIETVVTTTPARVSFALGEPGFIVCEVQAVLPDGSLSKDAVLCGAGFEPSRLRTALARPADYDAFWESAFKEQAAIPPDFTSVRVSNGLERISCKTVWGTRMYGFLRLPKGTGPFPLQVTVGGGDSMFCVESAARRTAIHDPANTAVLMIHLPAWEPSMLTRAEARATNAQWYAERKITPGELIYWNCEKGPRERWYYRCILGACRLIDYAVTRAEINAAKVYYYGASTGGGYGVFLAAFSPHIKAAICEVPNYGNMAGPAVGRPSGEDDRGKYWKTSLYFDGAWCAPRIKCPVFMSCGYWDQCCTPETIYCIFNELNCTKMLYDKVDNGHCDCPPGYAEVRNAWLTAWLFSK